MSEYPLIDPADVRVGDVVRGTFDTTHPFTVEATVHISSIESACIGPYRCTAFSDLRLVHRPAPPEPALRVGDFVRDGTRREWQITWANEVGACAKDYGWGARFADLTRIEPPVGWPVAVPDTDAPGGVRWWVKYHRTSLYLPTEASGDGIEWPDLVAANGVPARAPEPTP